MKKKQVIVMRTDLGMSTGRMVAQGAHASIAVLLNLGKFEENCTLEADPHYFSAYLSDHWCNWINGHFTKVVVKCQGSSKLDWVIQKAKQARIPYSEITDDFKNEDGSVRFEKTCVAIGPADSDVIDFITGRMKLL